MPAQSFKPTIVVADDEAHIRLVVAERFREAGYAVVEARDGEEALDAVRQHRPVALITDLQMPYMNGLEVCATLASNPETARVPAILLTARGHILDPQQVSKTIIRRMMSKPFSVRALLENVAEMIAAQQAPLREAA